jgi:tRNA(adenine34) deaminase
MHDIIHGPEAPNASRRRHGVHRQLCRRLSQSVDFLFDQRFLRRLRAHRRRVAVRNADKDEAGFGSHRQAADGSVIREEQRTAGTVTSSDAIDKAMMARCIELSRIAVNKGEYPFGTVIALDGQIVAEGINSTIRDGDVTRHAEIVALSHAQKTIGQKQLRRSTLYSNIEPCAMCAYCIREAWISRVVYALGSPVMGGLSKWNVLRDDDLSDRIPEIFGAVPEVVSGLLLHEAQQAWREWSPFAWEMIKFRRLLTAPCGQGSQIHIQPAHNRSLRHYLHILFMRTGQARNQIGRLAARRRDL